MAKIIIVAAMANNRVIGDGMKLPWHFPADLQFFKMLTMGSTIVMGRKTFESIGKVLPGRTTVVLTRDQNYKAPEGVIVSHSLTETLIGTAHEQQVFIVGGAELYAQAFEHADEMIITEIKKDVKGDIRFPEFDGSQWAQICRGVFYEPTLDLEYHHVTYENVGVVQPFAVTPEERMELMCPDKRVEIKSSEDRFAWKAGQSLVPPGSIPNFFGMKDVTPDQFDRAIWDLAIHGTQFRFVTDLWMRNILGLDSELVGFMPNSEELMMEFNRLMKIANPMLIVKDFDDRFKKTNYHDVAYANVRGYPLITISSKELEWYTPVESDENKAIGDTKPTGGLKGLLKSLLRKPSDWS